jgi:glutamyl-tRNA synthetase
MVQKHEGKNSGIGQTRFAPTPSGFLHAGNAANALIIFGLAAKYGAKVLLRIDDLDAARVRPEYLQDIFQVLDGLHLHPDQGPKNPAEMAEWSQHRRLKNYQQLLDQLVATGRVYACRCSRNQLLQAGYGGRYPGVCRHKNLPLDQPGLSWRLNTEGLEPVSWQDAWLGPQTGQGAANEGDFIIRRKDGLPAYHVASLSDDVQFGIDLIVRGQDLAGSTATQLQLAQLAGLEAFGKAVFVHHPLLKSPDGQKLSKSAGAAAISRTASSSQAAENRLSPANSQSETTNTPSAPHSPGNRGPSPAEHYRNVAVLLGADPGQLPKEPTWADLLEVFNAYDLPHPGALHLSL